MIQKLTIVIYAVKLHEFYFKKCPLALVLCRYSVQKGFLSRVSSSSWPKLENTAVTQPCTLST